MKFPAQILLALFILIICENNLSAQRKQIGVNLGLGKTDFESPMFNPLYKGYQYLDDYFNIGLSYLYTPKKVFSLKSGLYYNYRGSMHKISFLSVPIGMDLSIGKTVQFVFGFGLYSGLMISYSASFDPNKLIIGFEGNFGINFKLSSTINFNISYQKNLDMTHYYEEHLRSPGGAKYSNVYRGYDGYLSLSLRFDLINK
jgi:hypothetical protein